jgi:hypothetical protein
VVVKLKSLLSGEYAENEFRKQFTPSERSAIGQAVEEELVARERRGRPAALHVENALLPGAVVAAIEEPRDQQQRHRPADLDHHAFPALSVGGPSRS